MSTGKDLENVSRSPFYVPPRYRVAEYDENNIQIGDDRPKLFSWRGWRSSVFYYTWRQTLGFICCYYIIQVIYRQEIRSYPAAESKFHDMVENWAGEVKVAAKDLIFLLGFYVSVVAKRWWDQVYNIPEIDQLVVTLGGLAVIDKHNKEQVHQFKITVIRNCLLAYTLIMRKISKGMKKEFWSVETLLTKRMVTPQELSTLDTVDIDDISSKWFVPLSWANERIKEAKFGNPILVPMEHKQIINSVRKFQDQLQRVQCYFEHPMPTVYKQVVIFAVCSFFALAVVAEQELIYDPGEEKESFNFGFPIFLLLKFIFIAGWLSVAETIRNPFGEDEEDINIVRCLDNNIWVSSVLLQQQENIPINEYQTI